VFFWSEEHATEQRRRSAEGLGLYLTPSQVVALTRLIQSALFALPR